MTRMIVALNPPDRNADFIYFAKLVANSLAKEPLFAQPSPPLAAFEAHIAELVDAEAHTLTRTRGAASARNAKRAVVHGFSATCGASPRASPTQHPRRKPRRPSRAPA